MSKKILTLFLLVGIVFAISRDGGTRSVEAETITENGFTITDGVLTKYTGSAAVVKIPDSVHTVGGFSGNKTVKEVIIPDSVRWISSGAFSSCTELVSVTMSKNLEGIGSSAFKSCSKLQDIDLSQTRLCSMGNSAFEGCSVLTEVQLPQGGISQIPRSCFEHCRKLSGITLPEGIRVIGGSAFYDCSSLLNIELPDSLEYLGNSAFAYCDILESIRIPAGVHVLNEDVFYKCNELKSVYLPDTVTVIRYRAFCPEKDYLNAYLGSLRSIYLPDSVQAIDDGAFANGSSLKTIQGGVGGVVQEYAEEHGDHEFYPYFHEFEVREKDVTIQFDACGGQVEMSSKMAVSNHIYGFLPEPEYPGMRFAGWYTQPDYIGRAVKTTDFIEEEEITLYAKWEPEQAEVPAVYRGDAEDFMIANGVLQKYQGSERVVVVPEGVTVIEDSAFAQNTRITKVVLPDTVRDIRRKAFFECGALEEIVMPDTLETIGQQAFYGCDHLLELRIPEGVETLPASVCYGCNSLLSAQLPSTLQVISSSAFYSNHALQGIALPEGLISMEDRVFIYCENLQDVVLPDAVKTIGIKGFSYCESLVEITVPGGIEVLSSQVFDNCSSLKRVHLLDGLKEIGSQAFSACDQLKSIFIPESVTVIHQGAFSVCDILAGFEGIAGSVAENSAEGLNLSFTPVSYDGTITFDANGGSCDKTKKSVIQGRGMGILPVPVRQGYVFVGWSTQPAGGRLAKTTDLVTTAAMTLYAVWEKEVLSTPTPEPTESEPPLGTPSPDVDVTELPTGTPSPDVDVTEPPTGEPTGTSTETPGKEPGEEPTGSPSQMPSGQPSQSPEITAPPNGTVAPTQSPAPTDSSGEDTEEDSQTSQVVEQNGKTYQIGIFAYKILSVKKRQVSIVACGKADITSISVPGTVKIGKNRYQVTQIGDQAFAKLKKLKKVTIGSQVAKIGKKAFYQCPQLRKVVIQSKVLTKVGAKAFDKVHFQCRIKVPKAKLKKYKKLLGNRVIK